MNASPFTLTTVCVALSLTLAFGGRCGMAAEPFRGNLTGKDMLGFCKDVLADPMKDFEKGMCFGFIDGFMAGHFVATTWHYFHHRNEKMDEIYGRLCVPKEMNRTEMAKIYVRHLEAHRDSLAWNAGQLLDAALREAYPCPE